LADKQANQRAAQAAAQVAAELAADIQKFSVRGYEVGIGPIRHRACEPLYRAFDSLPYGSGRTVQEGMASAAGAIDVRDRQSVWDGVVFTGDLAKIPCEYKFPVTYRRSSEIVLNPNTLRSALCFAIVSWLNAFLVSDPDREVEGQPSSVRILKLPYVHDFVNYNEIRTDDIVIREYFTNFRGEGTDLAPFLGASLAAKVCRH
jgi:actin-related protein 9